ncbi:MAG: GDYXXLXY domain-containing protein [Parvibaculum sp.]|uniref:GDYXXLXY domain-containing protein n=1 Tax=Parvibaculum sp. TaxID=2024848 RepID=UPI0025FCAF77|nr:GDYXXLXY domain-containing protein [Parvibaculum sp.]MCE9651307.1 GDYXXLXY domain-containing protein [Parvibaculum sp.]
MIARLGRFGTAVVALAAVQTLILGWMVMDRIALLRSPDVVTLKSEPVDPRDLFRGDYVTLAYGISRLPLDGMPGETGFDIGDTIYIELAEAPDTWRAVAVYRNYPTPGLGHKVIRGRIVDMSRNPLVASIAFGIESYFVPEGEGRTLEQERNARNLSVDVALASDGEAAITGIRIEGELAYQEPLF